MTAYSIELTTRDGARLHCVAAPEDTLLAAAARADINLPSQCLQGSCGACHAQVVAGHYRLDSHNPAALPAGEGQVLLCRTTACSDLSVALPYGQERILACPVPRRQARIETLVPVAEDVVRLELCLLPDEDGSAADFVPGQFIEIELPDGQGRRAYSLANTANWEGRLVCFIRLQPGGRFAAFLRDQARPGLTVWVRGPQGAFGLDAASLRPRWFVAGGTGLAPVLAMLHQMADYQESQPARLFFGANDEASLFAREELADLQARLPTLRVEYCVWRPQPGWTGFAGTPVQALRGALAAGGVRPDLYVCGPAAMIDGVEAVAAEFGIAPGRVFSERFLPA